MRITRARRVLRSGSTNILFATGVMKGLALTLVLSLIGSFLTPGAREGGHSEGADAEGEEAQRTQQGVWKGQLTFTPFGGIVGSGGWPTTTLVNTKCTGTGVVSKTSNRFISHAVRNGLNFFRDCCRVGTCWGVISKRD